MKITLKLKETSFFCVSVISLNRYKMSNAVEETEPQLDDEENVEDLSKNHFGGIIGDFLVSIPWKMAFMLFILFILISSDIFNQNILANISNASESYVGPVPSSKGTVVQGIALSLMYIILFSLSEAF